jgi:hypothetical protein
MNIMAGATAQTNQVTAQGGMTLGAAHFILFVLFVKSVLISAALLFIL